MDELQAQIEATELDMLQTEAADDDAEAIAAKKKGDSEDGIIAILIG